MNELIMNELKIFENKEFGRIRIILINEEPWIVGKDAAEALGYENSRKAIADHIDDEDKQIIQRSQSVTLEIPNRGMTIINESGLYSLIFGSKLDSAKCFKHWVTSEVLPAIRKSGSVFNEMIPDIYKRKHGGFYAALVYRSENGKPEYELTIC